MGVILRGEVGNWLDLTPGSHDPGSLVHVGLSGREARGNWQDLTPIPQRYDPSDTDSYELRCRLPSRFPTWYRVNVKTPTDLLDSPPRTRATTTGTLVGTRFQADLLEAVDQWRKRQPDLPTRPEAVRRLVGLGMAEHPIRGRKSETNR